MRYITTNNKTRSISNFNIHGSLDVCNYVYGEDMQGSFLSKTSNFTLPTPLYDSDQKIRQMVLKSNAASTSGIGVLLTGEKGTGKTICAKRICQEANLPVIIINDRLPIGSSFKSFIMGLQQDAIIFIDEFEKLFKTYDDKDFLSQSDFLSLLDGIKTDVKLLFIFTSNSEVNQYFMNRPSRIKYVKNYKGIDDSLANTIIDEVLEDKAFKEDLLSNISMNEMTIDILISIIKEINLHKIPYSEFADIFNYQIVEQDYHAYLEYENTVYPMGILTVTNRNNQYVYVEDLDYAIGTVLNLNEEETETIKETLTVKKRDKKSIFGTTGKYVVRLEKIENIVIKAI